MPFGLDCQNVFGTYRGYMYDQCGKLLFAKCECTMILASISILVLAILASWHVCAKYDNLLLDSGCNKINSPKSIEWIDRM